MFVKHKRQTALVFEVKAQNKWEGILKCGSLKLKVPYTIEFESFLSVVCSPNSHSQRIPGKWLKSHCWHNSGNPIDFPKTWLKYPLQMIFVNRLSLGSDPHDYRHLFWTNLVFYGDVILVHLWVIKHDCFSHAYLSLQLQAQRQKRKGFLCLACMLLK